MFMNYIDHLHKAGDNKSEYLQSDRPYSQQSSTTTTTIEDDRHEHHEEDNVSSTVGVKKENAKKPMR